ncbi:hypothetical protein OC846_000913 [Tilletia horrida]|uniref:Uncharacterized protein n=1 Tax=Tilletia horrida TaxID=155126 RepID=A0AAN6GV00_9BASI|nr:hypothetical protein OC845_000822 [Tilletia horrida]KAK0556725.1 hypothetical protein OC846_000913 [Tilletia horrida]
MLPPSTTPAGIHQPSAPSQDMMPMSDLSRLTIPSNLPEGCDVKLLSQFLDRQMSRKVKAFETILGDQQLLTCPLEDPWEEVTPRIPNPDLKVMLLELKIAMDAANASSELAAKVIFKAHQSLLTFETLWQATAAKFESTYSKGRLEMSKRESLAPRQIPIPKLSLTRKVEIAKLSALKFADGFDEDEISFHVARAQNKVLRDDAMAPILFDFGGSDLWDTIKAITTGKKRVRPHHVDPTTIQPSIPVPESERAKKMRPLSAAPTGTTFHGESPYSARSSTPPPHLQASAIKKKPSVVVFGTKPTQEMNDAATNAQPSAEVVQSKRAQKMRQTDAAAPIATFPVPATPYPGERPSSARPTSPPPAPSRRPTAKRSWEQERVPKVSAPELVCDNKARSRPQSQPLVKTTSTAPLPRSALSVVPSRATVIATSERPYEHKRVPGNDFLPTKTYPTHIPSVRASSAAPLRATYAQTAPSRDYENLPPLTLPSHMRLRPRRR